MRTIMLALAATLLLLPLRASYLDTLRGIPAYAILVETLPPELTMMGFSCEQFEAQAAERLRAATIPVVEMGEARKNPAVAVLYVAVNGQYLNDRTQVVAVAFSVRVQVLQQAVLMRAPESPPMYFTTWMTSTMGYCGMAADPTGGCRKLVGGELDLFVNASLTANAPPPPAAKGVGEGAVPR